MSKSGSRFVNAGWYNFKFNGLNLSNYVLQSHASDSVGTLHNQVLQNTKGTQHAYTGPSATLR